MVVLSLLTIVAIYSLILQYKQEHTQDNEHKKTIGKRLTAVSIVLLIATNFWQWYSSEDLEKTNEVLKETNLLLSKKSDSTITTLNIINRNQNALRERYDSLYSKYAFSQLLLNEANKKLAGLAQATKEGFTSNEKAIEKLKQIQVRPIREVSQQRRQEFINKLRKGAGSTIEFGTFNAQEPSNFSSEIRSLFTEANWIVKNDYWLAPDPGMKGLFFFANANLKHEHDLLVYEV